MTTSPNRHEIGGNDMSEETVPWGGSKAAVQYHYDVGNDFYGLWLDATRTYSCAFWRGAEDTGDLNRAQLQKIDLHVEQAGASGAARVLDVGCGWGSTLERLVGAHGVRHAVGLTLSQAQADHIRARSLPGTEVRVESWADHAPTAAYDAIISIGALEHFAPPSYDAERRISVYRDFFRRCASWLKPGGRLSLQTISYGSMKPEEASKFMQTEIFPDAELPRLGDLVAAADQIFEIQTLRNDRLHYARTSDLWLKALRAQRTRAVDLVGEETVARYEHYLRLSVVGFSMGKLGLLRLSLRAMGSNWRSGEAKPHGNGN
jgi:cyclopropane-fatty-acyl-phospholipid synthase